MNEFVNLDNILDIYEKEVSKNVKNKHKVYLFEKNKMQNIISILETLKSLKYDGGIYNIFLISEPKHRIVMALNLKDKIINHFIAKYVLERKLTKYLDIRNIATRKNMGTNYGYKLLNKYLEKCKKYDDFYVLKIDISKYFYTIDHNILLNLLEDKLTIDEYNILKNIINSTNRKYINNRIKKIKEKYLSKHHNLEKEINKIPYYEYGKGLPIGNMTSQFLSIFYLYELDHYIVNNLHIKYYIRYMDDFILIHHDKEVLKNALKEISDILKNKYKLKINKDKTKITNIKEGFSFLGYTYHLHNKKTVIKIKKESFDKVKKRVKEMCYLYQNGKVDFNTAFSSIMSYWHNHKYGNVIKVRKAIDRYWFDRINDGIKK